MTPHLILTVDYEIFGNGQGCLKHCVVEPAYRLLRLADRFDAPITLFAEVAEMMAIEREMGEAAVRDVREQLRRAALAGHDVQLHLHPQWQGAKKHASGAWDLDLSRWRIGDLPEAETEQLIALGKEWLDEVAFANAPGRGCIAFRAGNWCIQPSAAVVRSLRRQGFKIESTVVPGMRRSGEGEWSDFRSSPNLPFWRVDGDVCEAASSGLWEVPIASAKVTPLTQLTAECRARLTDNSRFAPNCHGSYSVRPEGAIDRVATNFRKLLDLGVAKLDFSTIPAPTLIAITEDWIQRFGNGDAPTPIVAIAHTKNWTHISMSHLAEYLTWARDADIRFSTYSEWLDSSNFTVGLDDRPRRVESISEENAR